MHLVQTLSSGRHRNTGRMEKNPTTQRILNLTLEIIYVLTGEDYEVVKKQRDNTKDCSCPCGSEKVQRNRNLTGDAPPVVVNETNKDRQILEPTNKLLHLLTKEVHGKREDLTVCFTVEEQEDTEDEQKDYKQVVVEDPQFLHSLDGSRNRNIPQVSSGSPLAPGRTEQDHKVPVDGGGEMFNVQCKEEESLTEISPEAPSSRSDKGEGNSLCCPQDYVKDENEPSEELQNDQEDEVLIVHCKEEEVPTEISSGLSIGWEDNPGGYNSFQFARTGTNFRTANLPDVTLSKSETFLPNFSSSEEEFHVLNPLADPRSMDCPAANSKSSRSDTNLMANTGQERPLNFTNAFYTPRTAQTAAQRSPHQPGVSYICSDCGKEFKQHRLLLRHKKIHTGEKPFTCSDCGSSFRLSSELLTHRRKHTGERPYACPDCDKRFKHNRNLKTHRLSHIGEKPFTCAECHKSFRARSVLVRHQLIHTGEKPYSCSFCDRRFIQKSNLLRHLVVHTRDKTLH